jgi:hypothetical protein
MSVQLNSQRLDKLVALGISTFTQATIPDLAGVTRSNLLPVDYAGRMFREGKATISAELTGFLERLGSDAERWWSRLEKLNKGRLLGRFFAASRDRLRQAAKALGVHHLANLGGCAAR